MRPKNMMMESLNENGVPKGKCLCEKCAECALYRLWNVQIKPGENRIERKCSLESIFFILPGIIGSIDGCQAATNETRNQTLEFGRAAVQAINGMAVSIPEFETLLCRKMLEMIKDA
jgi:hypothetical protein